jgi:hypothetical protein
MLLRWYEELQHEAKTGFARDSFDRYSKFTKQQKEVAVKHYFENGKRVSRTIRALVNNLPRNEPSVELNPFFRHLLSFMPPCRRF